MRTGAITVPTRPAHRWPWFSLLATVLVLGALFATGAPTARSTEPVDGLPDSSKAVQAYERQQQLPSADVQTAIVVLSRTDGAAPGDVAVRAARDAVQPFAAGELPPASTSPDGTVALLVVPLEAADDDAAADAVEKLRDALANLPDGTKAEVTGGPAFTADLQAVFAGADLRLLLVTLAVVAILLLITYRSPFLWLVPLVVVAAAEQAVRALTAQVLPRLDLAITGDVTGISSVLVFGAATDYALLLIARYREELRVEADHTTAMSRARKGTRGAILASGGTVVLAVLTLLLSDLAGQRALAVASALGVAVAVLSALVVLPALLTVFGRRIFWPFIPQVGDEAREGKVWGRLGAGVRKRPRTVVLASVAALAAVSAGALGVNIGLSETEQFRVKPEAVLGAETLATAFPAGSSQPTAVLVPDADAQAAAQRIAGVEGVESARPGESGGGYTQVDVVLSAEPGTAESDEAIRAVQESAGSSAAVGGPVAQQLEVKEANERNVRLILPVILVLVGLVLVALLRSLVAPVLLVLTVVLSYAASVGAGWLVSTHVFGFPALDTPVLLLSFVFLVALGVDYNIFLVTRAREDTADTRDGMQTALRVTGGVITSAGVLLAAVFAVLGVLPLVTLTQVGVIICIGVLLDTLVVRTVLVPALAFWLGKHFWWPAARS